MPDEIRFAIDPDGTVTVDLDSAPEAELVVEAVNAEAVEAFRSAKGRTVFGDGRFLCG